VKTVYQPSLESLRSHPIPDWYHDAKLGIFIHWSLSSVPGFAPREHDIIELMHEASPDELARRPGPSRGSPTSSAGALLLCTCFSGFLNRSLRGFGAPAGWYSDSGRSAGLR